MKRKIAYLIVATIVILAVAVVSVSFMSVSLDKSISVSGYKINIPEKWSSDSKGNIYDKAGNLAGSFTLVDAESENPPYLENVSSEISRDFLSDTVSVYEFSDGDKNAVIYYIKKLPNPEPYAAELLFYGEYVSKRLAEKIYNTFQIPQMGENPPPKNISIPENGEKIIRITDVTVSNIGALSEFGEKLSAKQSCSVDILEYKQEGEETSLKSWYSLESDDGIGYMYSYHEKEDGTYTYDNNAVIFSEISKTISNEEDTTSYFLKRDGEEDTLLIKIPLDRLRDNAKELIAMKSEMMDNVQVRRVLEKILTNEEINGLNVDVDEQNVLITFGKGIKADKGKAYSYAAVLFGLAEKVDSVKIKYEDGSEFAFTKEEINKTTKSDVDKAATSEESFVQYTEEIKEKQEETSADGQVVYSGTVVISYNTMVTHPDTGERVAIGPYAEARGYGGYLGKAISCVIRRSGSGYIATASCGGSVIASYPLNSESDLNWAIGMIQAYS